MGMVEGQGGRIAVGVQHGIVVHVRPNQGLKFENTPHGLIGITNLAADASGSTFFAKLLECCLNLIRPVEIEAWVSGGKDRHRLTCLVRGQQLTRYSFSLSSRHRAVHRSKV